MITPPRRSVTRFFIPLIDVLILLFCIFILMPFVSAPARPDPDVAPKEEADARALQKRVAELEQQVKDAKLAGELADERLKRFETSRRDRRIEIDPDTGHLYYRGPGGRREQLSGKPGVSEREEALQIADWVAKEQYEADRDKQYLYLSILYPQPTKEFEAFGHPTEADLAKYERWFEKVPHGVIR